MMTMAPPVVQPSLGLMALMHGVAKKIEKKESRLPFGGWSLEFWGLAALESCWSFQEAQVEFRWLAVTP